MLEIISEGILRGVFEKSMKEFHDGILGQMFVRIPGGMHGDFS